LRFFVLEIEQKPDIRIFLGRAERRG